jgi:hypothetical protein
MAPQQQRPLKSLNKGPSSKRFVVCCFCRHCCHISALILCLSLSVYLEQERWSQCKWRFCKRSIAKASVVKASEDLLIFCLGAQIRLRRLNSWSWSGWHFFFWRISITLTIFTLIAQDEHAISGQFMSVLQPYFCIQRLGLHQNPMCTIALSTIWADLMLRQSQCSSVWMLYGVLAEALQPKP